MTKHVLCYLFIVSLIKVGTIMAGHRHIHTTEKTHADSITSGRRHGTCTMEEVRNLNFCRTNGDGASELQHKIV